MRCPYCGSLNPDTSRYCVRCGRDFVPQAYRQAPPRPAMPQQAPGYHPPQPVQRPHPAPPTPPTPPYQGRQAPQRPPVTPPAETTAARRRHAAPVVDTSPPAPPPPDPVAPAPFPPKNIEQLQALRQGALNYAEVSDTKSYGKKRVVRISFAACAPWQQVATLLAALQQYDDARFETIVIQGVHEYDRNSYLYTNGQLTFDRNARLGSQILKRYQIETDNGYSSSSLRIVLSEPQ